jgi:uncharacterized protein (TIGR02996 family)
MPERSDLLAAILEAPDDDAPRLAYAEWLKQKGDARGELIVIQCALAGREGASPVRRAELEARAPRSPGFKQKPYR